jgi:lysophospholipid acyltransferase (LPLAT)-like uncharacterized protein
LSRAAYRRARSIVLRWVLVRPVLVLFRLLAATWRIRASPQDVERVKSTPRVILVTYHGMGLELLPCARLFAGSGRPIVVLVSPSLAGELLEGAFAAFGVEVVYGRARKRGVAGSLEFIRRIRRGSIGIVAADGSRGPCAVVRPGVTRLAAVARATLVSAMVAPGPGITLPTWDRTHVSVPFARLDLFLSSLGDAPDTVRLGRLLRAEAARARSPVLPPGLRGSESSSALRAGEPSAVDPAEH